MPATTGRSPILLFLFLAIFVVVVFLMELAFGSVRIPLGTVLDALVGNPTDNPGYEKIIWLFRFPRAITAMLAGAALGLAGLQMQTLFRNPLADPFILGISSGASLGVALVVMIGGGVFGGIWATQGGFLGDASLAVSAAFGSAIVFFLVLAVARSVQNNMTLLILGLLFGYATSALVSVCMHFARQQHLQAYILWTFGSFGGVTWGQMRVFAPAVFVGLFAGMVLIKPQDALLLGEDYARSMGVAVGAVRILIIASASILAGTVTAFCGPIGFVGVAVPHLCRSLFGTSGHRILVFAVILAGAGVCMLADLFAQLPGSDSVLPLNAVTSLIGAPVVIAVILRRENILEAS